MGFIGDVPSSTGLSPSALPDSNYTAFEKQDSPGALPSISQPSNGVMPADTPFWWGHTTSENSKSFIASGLLAEEAHPHSVPSLRPSKPVLGSSPQFETAAKLSTNWTLTRTHSAKQSLSPSPMPTISQLQPQSNIYITSMKPAGFARSAAPQLGLYSKQKSTVSKQQDGASEQALTLTTSLPGQPLGSPNLAFADLPADQSFSSWLDVGQLSSSSAHLVVDTLAHDINILPHPDEIPTPGYFVPFITPHPKSPSSEPTMVSPEDFYPTNMELEWGSGDYLETMSFLNSDFVDYPPVTKVPSDLYDLEDYTESYDTSFPSRVGISPSSLHPPYRSLTPSLVTTYITVVPLSSTYAPSFPSTIHYTLKPTTTSASDISDASHVDWPDTFSIQPTDVLLPDMNSLEYYTTQLSKDNNSLDTGVEHRGNFSVVSISSTDITPSSNFTNDTKLTEQEPSGEMSGLEPHDESTTVVTTEESPQVVNTSETFLDSFITPTHFFDLSSSPLGSQVSTTDWSAPTLTLGMDNSASTDHMSLTATPLLPDDVISYSSLTDVHWFITESIPPSTIHSTPVLTATIAFFPIPTPPAANTTADTTELTPKDSTFKTQQTFNISLVSTEPMSTITLVPPDLLGDQGVTEDGVDIPATMTLIPTSSDANTVSAVTTTTTATNISHQATTRTTATTEAAANVTIVSATSGKIRTTITVVYPPPKFVFRVVSGQVVYTAISVINALQRSGRHFLSLSPNWTTPDNKYQIHTVLQFVPSHIDVRFCNFSESIEKGLTMAFAEVRRRSKESTNFTVHIVNITMAAPKYQEQQVLRQPVDITFTIRASRGYLTGSEVSNALMELTMVEFSYYMVVSPFQYTFLNTSQLLRSSWVRTVLLGVLDQKVGERTFQANMERRVAMLLGEAMGLVRRVKRDTTIGNSSVQVVRASRLVGADHPLEIVYFVEGPSGQRMPADQAANLLNRVDVQRAAIILGYRVQGVLSQPVEKTVSSPSDTENTNMWIIIGVVIPLLVVIVIISILYWKLCRTDKLEFQPDAMASIQQRQKLQAPSVKGFDFAKLHLGQQSKDDVMVIQEPLAPGSGPGPLPMPTKEGLSQSENGEIPTPISKNSASSTKVSRNGRRRGRSVISPSDSDSVVNSSDGVFTVPMATLACIMTSVYLLLPSSGPPPTNSTNEQLSSASIFEHVDRMSRGTDASKRLPNKVQLIAMQPMPVPPPVRASGKLSDSSQINKEIQVALRHKSEIEHHRNKIRLRAKRKGHYDFPAMDDMTSGLADGKDQDRIYQKAQLQIDKILDPDAQMASIFMGSKKSGRGRHSPKQRVKEQLNGGRIEADKDQLITEDCDAAYRKLTVLYICQGSPHRSPSPTDDIFLGPAYTSPGHAPPPPAFMLPQPSIEEARQQMHSLLDDAFALVSPTSQSSMAGITLPGVNANPQASSPPGRGPRHCSPSYPALGPFPGVSSHPPGISSTGYITPNSLYSSRGLYTDELLSSARPRPVGGTTGAQLHHLTQVGLSSRLNGYPAGVRAAPGHNGRIGWNRCHDDSRTEPEKDIFLDSPDYSPCSIFQTPRSVIREPSAPLVHLDTPNLSYLSAPPSFDTSPPTHSSASLIKAIREELLRLSQKQAAVPSYHS
uniref:Uncharacterized protein n=1 Tax=Mola mola TaxID=94237 RepID=A0A3Q3XGS7_MOLML